MDKKIQAAVQAEVEAVLARMNPPASSATSTILPVPVPTTSAVSHPGKPLHFLLCSFFFSDHPCVGLSLPSRADLRAPISPLRDSYLHVCKCASATTVAWPLTLPAAAAAAHGTGLFHVLKRGCSLAKTWLPVF